MRKTVLHVKVDKRVKDETMDQWQKAFGEAQRGENITPVIENEKDLDKYGNFYSK